MKDSKNRLFEMMNKVSGMPLNENTFDITNKQSEESFNNTDNINDDDLDWKNRLIKDLKNNGIKLESFFNYDYFIKCKNNSDFYVHFYRDGVKIEEYNGETKESKENVFKEYDDVLNYILSKKEQFTNIESQEDDNLMK